MKYLSFNTPRYLAYLATHPLTSTVSASMLRKIVNQILPDSVKQRIQNYRTGTPIDDLDLVRTYLTQAGVRQGLMVDVGAHVGGSLAPFARRGWTIHAFEPDQKNRAELRTLIQNEGFTSVRVDARAVANRTGEVSFYQSEVSSGISSLSSFHPSHTEMGKVQLIPLREYVANKGVEKIDLLKIDTEGHDLFVLESLDWDTHRPRAIVCEFEDRKTEPLGYTVKDMHRFLSERGYGVLISEWHPIVEYGRRHQWRQFTTDLETLDTHAWGNLIAVPHAELSALQALIP